MNFGKTLGRDITTMQLSFNVRSVSEIDEVKFEFKATTDIVMHWSDLNIWATCEAGGREIDQGACQYVWRPSLLFPNAIEFDIPEERKYIWTDLRTKSVTYQFQVSGTFTAPMSFRTFPKDEQKLPITLAIESNDSGSIRAALRWDPVSAQLDNRITENKGVKDTISGWTVLSVEAREHSHLPLDWNKLAGDDGPMRSYMDEMVQFYNITFGVEIDIKQESTVSAVTCDVTVRRTTVFYMLNYIMVVMVLTSLSWITFIIAPSDLNDRCGISLTLLLALNVFQLILSELMPKTGYLTPMHEFVIVSTFFTVAAAIESVLSHVLNKRVALRAAFVNKVAATIGESGRKKKIMSATSWGHHASTARSTSPNGNDNDSGEDGDGGGTAGVRDGDANNEAWVPVKREGGSFGCCNPTGPGGGGGGFTLESLEYVLAKYIDNASLILFPVTYAAYSFKIFGFAP